MSLPTRKLVSHALSFDQRMSVFMVRVEVSLIDGINIVNGHKKPKKFSEDDNMHLGKKVSHYLR